MFLEVIITLLGFLFALDFFHRRRRNALLQASRMPGHPSLPFIGGAFRLRGLNAENLVDFFGSNVRTLGKTYYSWVLHQLIIFDADAKDMEILLTNQVHIRKNLVYDKFRCWMGDGLLLSTGKKWHQRRKIITPAFHFKILEQFVEVFDKQSGILVEKLEEFADGETVIDVFPFVCLTALDIIAESAMGVEVNAQMNPDLPYVRAVKTVSDIIAERMRRPHWGPDWMFRLTASKIYAKMMDNIDVMHTFTDDVIIKRRLLLKTTTLNEREEDEDDFGSKKRLALLDVLLRSTVDGKPLTNDDIREEVETFMFAGHDTTTSAISFTLYLIARHPEVQRRLVDEITQVMGLDKASPVDYRQLQELRYMDCVIKESLRLYPPVPIIGRHFTEDFRFNGKTIPANSHLNVPLFLILRDADYFPDPDTFKPERFEGDGILNINSFAFTPFSAGPRNCIGQKFSNLEMKSVISKFLRYYELLPLGPDVRRSLSLVLRSATGMSLGLRPRKYE